MRTQKKTFNIFVFLISIVIASGCFLKHGSLNAQIVVMLEADTNVWKYEEKIKLTYTIKNTGDSSIYFFDRSFVTAKLESGKVLYVFPRELIIRADWRECKGDYVLIEPGDKISHTYNYELMSSYDPETGKGFFTFPKTIYFKYEVTRTEADNFYYDFEHEHIEATTKIPIDAWTGTLESNEVKVELVE
jgi:hypothetical protein